MDRAFDKACTQSIDASSTLDIYRRGTSDSEPITLPIGDPMLEEIVEFADCVMTGKQPDTDGHASLRALSLIRAAIASARSSMPVEVEKP